MSKDRGFFSPTISYSLAGPGNTNRFRASVGLTDGTDPHVFSTHAFAFNAFHHTVMTWDGYDLRLYVNGELEGDLSVQSRENQNPPKTIVYGEHDVGIGRHPIFGGRNFNGRIDEPSIYIRALTSTEVRALYAANRAGKCLDSSPPAVSIDLPLDGAVVGAGSVLVSGSVTDASATTVTSTPAGIQATLPPGGGSFSGILPLEFEGENTLVVHAVDDPQNPPGGQSITVIRDTMDPDLDILSPLDGSVLAASPIQAIIAVADGTRVELELGGVLQIVEPGGPAATFTVELVGGLNVLTATATDAAGHTTTSTHTVVLDLDGPSVSIDSPAEGTVLGPGSSPTTVIATIDDLTATTVTSDPSGVSGSLPAGGGPVAGLIELVEGYNLIRISAIDAAGRSTTAERMVVFDSLPPTLVLASPSDGTLVRGVVDFDAEAADTAPGSGVDTVVLEVDGQPIAVLTAAPYGVDLDTNVLTDGAHAFSAVAVDGVGNTSPIASVSVIVDNTRPAAMFVGLSDGAIVTGMLSFQLQLSDAVSGVASCVVTINGSPPTVDPSTTFAPPIGSTTLAGVENTELRVDGPIVLSGVVTDAAGNVRTATVMVVVQNATATYTLTSPAPGHRVKGLVEVSAETTDPSVTSITLSVDGNVVGSGAGPTFMAIYDSRLRLDGPAEFKASFARPSGPGIERTVVVHINNLTVAIQPQTLHLQRRDGQQQGRIFATIEGPNANLLMPTEVSEIELRVPGGSPVPSTQEWPGDDTLRDRDGDGIPELRVRFERRQVVAAIRAGIAAGRIMPNSPLSVAIYARMPGGSTVLIGRDQIRIVGGD